MKAEFKLKHLSQALKCNPTSPLKLLFYYTYTYYYYNLKERK